MQPRTRSAQNRRLPDDRLRSCLFNRLRHDSNRRAKAAAGLASAFWGESLLSSAYYHLRSDPQRFPNPIPLMQITLISVRSNFSRTALSFPGSNSLLRSAARKSASGTRTV